MILVKNVEIEEKDNEEVVSGKHFINSRGETVCIGMPEHVQEILGMPFKALEYVDTILKEKQEFHIENTRLKQKCHSLELSIERIREFKFLFSQLVAVAVSGWIVAFVLVILIMNGGL